MEKVSLQQTQLFRGMTDLDVKTALRALHAVERAYPKGAIILHSGEPTVRMGLVLSGGVTIESCGSWGKRTILDHIGPGQLFAESYAILETEPLQVNVCVSEDCRVLLLDLTGLRRAEPWAAAVTRNLLTATARKNFKLSLRSFHTAPTTVRERVTAYLNTEAMRRSSREFDIPFDRQQLADYLNLDRTALSKELGKMRKDGLIEFRKNHFALLV